jgi:hypothetical protein
MIKEGAERPCKGDSAPLLLKTIGEATVYGAVRQLLFPIFRSVSVHRIVPGGDWTDAVALFVDVLKLALTRRSGAVWSSVNVHPDRMMVPLPE